MARWGPLREIVYRGSVLFVTRKGTETDRLYEKLECEHLRFVPRDFLLPRSNKRRCQDCGWERRGMTLRDTLHVQAALDAEDERYG